MPLLIIVTFLAAWQATQPVLVYEDPSHRPIFRNAQVRVLDVVLPPHASSLFHTHANDVAGVTIAPGPLRTEIPGEAPTDEIPDTAGDVWFEAHPTPATHRSTNLGDLPIHYLAIELLWPSTRSSSPPRLPAETPGPVVLENERIRMTRVKLASGQYGPTHMHAVGHVLVALSSGRVATDYGVSHSTRDVSPGFVFWHDAAAGHVLRNIGGGEIELIECEILR
jgi:quercetin dioxygenase-like cupin family protein